jgi:NAD(P)-dependent dehydrogenase (short-subunit alcohol dehydrogenase family)
MKISLKNVAVTGAASGLGQAVTSALVELGVGVTCIDADVKRLQAHVEELRAEGGEASAAGADVTDGEAIREAFASIAGHPLDGLVTCAGVQSKTPILDLTVSEWDRVLNINLRGTFLCVQNALRSMIPRERGRIVTIASDTGKRGGGRLAKSAYSASKGGVIAFTRSIARELAPFKGELRVNCLCPGPMFTHMHDGITPMEHDTVEKSVPLGRFGTPREVAAGVLFLLSDEATYVYGETLSVDGGVIMD